MSFDIEKFVIIDNHAHSILRKHLELDEIGFRQCFSESRSLSVLQDHMPHASHYMYLLDHLERILNIKSEQEFLAFRSRQPAAEYLQMLWDDVSIGAVILDDGFSCGDTLSIDELARVAQRPVFHCRRVEPLMESCIGEADSFSQLCKLYKKRLLPRGKGQTIAFKSICAYRGGLSILEPSQAEASKDFDKLKAELKNESGKLRITKGPLYHYLLLETFLLAAEAKIPVQIHCGIGDDDADLVESNPALLQPLFRQVKYARARFVLLHCFPYLREAAFLSSIYANVYMDLSLSVSLASGIAQSMIGEALAIAPASKVLAGTDGHSCPESHWFGALNWKRGLTFALFHMINSGMLTHREAEQIAALVLHDNAIGLYELQGLA